MEQAWARSKNHKSNRAGAMDLDNKIDGVIGGIYTLLKNNTELLDSNDPLNLASVKIIASLFPNGVKPIIFKPFEDQLVLNDTIIKRLKEDLSAETQIVGITAYLDRLTSLNQAFRGELNKLSSKEMSFDVLEAARAKGNLNIRHITAVILGTPDQLTEAAQTQQSVLLAPILDQCHRVREARKSRRRPRDINPQTGEESDGELAGTPSDEIK